MVRGIPKLCARSRVATLVGTPTTDILPSETILPNSMMVWETVDPVPKPRDIPSLTHLQASIPASLFFSSVSMTQGGWLGLNSFSTRQYQTERLMSKERLATPREQEGC